MLQRLFHNVPDGRRRLSPKIAVYLGAAALICTSVLLLSPVLFLNRLLQERIMHAWAKAYPSYSLRIGGLHYGILRNRLVCDSITLAAADSSSSCTISRVSLSGVGRQRLLRGDTIAPADLAGSIIVAEQLSMTLPRHGYELRCDRLHVEVADSAVAIDNLSIHPMVDDNPFFAASRFRQTRYTFGVPRVSVAGFGCIGILGGAAPCVHSLRMDSPTIDIVVNKDKSCGADSAPPVMPHTILASIMRVVEIDSVVITHGSLRYGERLLPDATPARLTFDSVRVTIGGMAHRPSGADTVMINADGIFMNAGTVSVSVALPIASRDNTFHYSGSLAGMNLSALNPFLEPEEQMRLKTGSLYSATVDIQVDGGHADGSLRAEYKDLSIVPIERGTGSESGIVRSFASFFANNIKLRTSNLPDDRGAMKIGHVQYTYGRGEAFCEFAWFAVRSGMRDMVGF